MSILNKLKAVRTSRWMAIVAASALIPLTAGCSTLETSALLWGVGYGYELLFTPLRAMIGTGFLNFVNTH